MAKATLIPHYFNERDYPWIVRFYDEFLRLKGRRRREVLCFFQGSLPFQSPEKKRALLFHLLLGESEDDGGRRVGKQARALRSVLFELSARSHEKPDLLTILSMPEIVELLPRIEEDPLELAFADLPLERRLTRVPEGLTAERIALMANLALAQSFVGRSAEVEIIAQGDVRRIVRQAKLRRLICQAEALERGDGIGRGPILRISGPLSLFGHTAVYGRSLSELVPLLAWCNKFSLSAITRIRGKDALYQIRSGDPLLPAKEPKRFDSQLEERFAREFSEVALDWELVREPEAFALNGSRGVLIFPDFLIRHRRDSQVRFYLEIVGYWTQEYLLKKTQRLREAGIENLILCIDESLGCGEGDSRAGLEKLGAIIFFRRRIRISDVLARIQRN